MLNKITNRLILGFSLPLVFLILLGAFLIASDTNLIRLQEENKETSETLKNTNELAYDISRIVACTRGYVLWTKDQYYRGICDASRKAMLVNRDELKSIADPQVREAVNVIIQEGEEFDRVSAGSFALVDDNKADEAKKQIKVQRLGKLEEARTRATQILEDRVKSNLEAAEKGQQVLLLVILLGTGLTILATALIGLWVARPIRQQLPKAVEAAERIADGDLRETVEVKQDGGEIGQLMAAFQNMAKNLHSLIFQTQKSGVQISTSATQIAAAGKQLEATVAEQLASTNEVTATAHQIAATSRALVKTMEQVAELSQSTAAAAGGSQADLNHMEAVMRQLAEATQSISRKLGVMSEKASNINSVVTTINKVADQTNLLSLNAAIEAEKAGEYGAGFAVVAREIRRLADQTAVATLEIAQMIKEMQGAVSTGVMEMDKFNKSMVDSVTDMGRISDQIAQVIGQVQGLTPRFEQASHAVEEQSQGAQQISEAMGQLSEASQQTADALRETNRALEDLDEAAHGLRSEISRFKTA